MRKNVVGKKKVDLSKITKEERQEIIDIILEKTKAKKKQLEKEFEKEYYYDDNADNDKGYYYH